MVTKNIGMRKMCANLVLMVFTDEQKNRRLKMYQELLDCVGDPNFPKNIITEDES